MTDGSPAGHKPAFGEEKKEMSLQSLECKREGIRERVHQLRDWLDYGDDPTLKTVSQWESAIAGASRERLEELAQKVRDIDLAVASDVAMQNPAQAEPLARRRRLTADEQEDEDDWPFRPRSHGERAVPWYSLCVMLEEMDRRLQQTEGRLENIEGILRKIRDSLARR